jgi:hypothetical protein
VNGRPSSENPLRKISILIPHYLSWKWIAACIHQFRTYQPSIDHEIIVCDNSMGHPSIKALTDTPLGEGVAIVQGDAELPSHGHGYEICAREAVGDWFFTAENDSFPTRHGWFEEYVKAAGEGYELIGPKMPMASGSYIHPAGACISRRAVDQAKTWQAAHKGWKFVPSSAVRLGSAEWPYHVVASDTVLEKLYNMSPMPEDMYRDIKNWQKAEVWQEMRSFDEDSLSSYGQRTGIRNWEPVPGKSLYNKIGYEAGQWLSYYCSAHGIKVKEAGLVIDWMPGRHGRQAAFSTVYGGFTHIWAGSSSLLKGLDDEVRNFKNAQAENWFAQVPEDIRQHIIKLEAEHA